MLTCLLTSSLACPNKFPLYSSACSWCHSHMYYQKWLSNSLSEMEDTKILALTPYHKIYSHLTWITVNPCNTLVIWILHPGSLIAYLNKNLENLYTLGCRTKDIQKMTDMDTQKKIGWIDEHNSYFDHVHRNVIKHYPLPLITDSTSSWLMFALKYYPVPPHPHLYLDSEECKIFRFSNKWCLHFSLGSVHATRPTLLGILSQSIKSVSASYIFLYMMHSVWEL
jgi:hypothetical protein